MQQLFDFTTTWFFAFGATEKTSLCAQYCRQNDYLHFTNPDISAFNKQLQKCAIIQGSTDLFDKLEKIKPDLSVIVFGQKFNNEREEEICHQYALIGRCRKIKNLNYTEFRKTMYPNLIFFYGPNQAQNQAAAFTLANLINYTYCVLPARANDLIASSKKSGNYVINGFFTNPRELSILQEYFDFRVIHFKYDRIQLPEEGQFFDKEYNLLPKLKGKPFYIPVKGSASPVSIMDDVGQGLCPKLYYANIAQEQDKQYVVKYLKQTDGIMLNITQIQDVNKRKGLPVAESQDEKIKRLTSIFYKDLNRKQIFLTGFPWQPSQFVSLQNINRKFSAFIDFPISHKHQYTDKFTCQIYFLQTQKLIVPNRSLPLACQLAPQVEYWIVNGVPGSGRTTVAKYIAAEFGMKHIQFDTYIGGVKEKLANPDDGQEVPLKKILQYFKKLIHEDRDTVYIIDSLPYEKNDLLEWVKVVGVPTIINLQVQEHEQVKRSRKKAGGDITAQISQQQAGNAKANSLKNGEWIQKLAEVAPQARIFKLNYNQPQLLAQNALNSIMRPRIYLVQKNNQIVYENIALKYELGFISLMVNDLHDCPKIVKNCNKRDIILCHYLQEEERLVSEDLYWIEKHLGEIRYLGIWEPEEKVTAEEELVLQKPVAIKKQPVVGEEGEQKQPEDPPAQEGEAAKKAFDIYEHKWTKPTTHKNLSQWFFKLKTNITQYTNEPKNCYQNFGNVLQKLNESSSNHIYETIR